MSDYIIKSIEKKTVDESEYNNITRNFSYGVGYDLIKKEPFSYHQAKYRMFTETCNDYLHIEWDFTGKAGYRNEYETTLYVFYCKRDAYLFVLDKTTKKDINLLVEKIYTIDLTKDATHVMDQIMFDIL